MLILRCKRKGGDLRLPNRKGAMTWCSGIVVVPDCTLLSSTNFSALRAGQVVDVLIDECTVLATHPSLDLEKMSEAQQVTTKECNTHLYYFTCESSAVQTRPEAIVCRAVAYHGKRIAPPSDEELYNTPDDPSTLHKEGKDERAPVFAEWLITTFGAENLCLGSGVVDIAAGRGALSAELYSRLGQIDHQGDGTFERERKMHAPQVPCFQTTLVEPTPRTDTPSILDVESVRVHVRVLREKFDATFAARYSELLKHASIFVGMHPDQATEAIVDQALALGRPFAVVPCCVFPKLFPDRRLVSGQHVKTCGGFLRYLKSKHEDIQMTSLGFQGRNRVLYWRGNGGNGGDDGGGGDSGSSSSTAITCGLCVDQTNTYM
jgi:hypothetical protein